MGLATHRKAEGREQSTDAGTVSVRRSFANPGGRRAWRPAGMFALVLFGVCILALLFFVAFPLAGIAWQSLRARDGSFTLANYVDFLQSNRLLLATVNTLLVAVASAIGSVLLATPLAFGVTRTAMRGKRLVYVSTVVTFASPGFLMTLAYILLAGPNAGLVNQVLRFVLDLDTARGPLNILSIWGFVLLAVPQATAFAFLIMVPAFQNMDLALEEASRVCGVAPGATLFKITLPMMRASMLAGGLLAFSTALAEFATPYILGIDVLTVSMYGAISSANFGLAAAIAAVSSVLSIIVLVLYRRSIRTEERYRTVAGRGVRVGNLDIGRARHIFTILGLTYSILGAVLPCVLIVLIAFMDEVGRGFWLDNYTTQHVRFMLSHPIVIAGITNSLILGLISATVIALLGFFLSYVITRTTFFARNSVDYLSILPLGVAGVAFGVGVIIINLETPLRYLALYGTIWILLVGYIGRYIPFGVRSAQVALLQLSAELEEASRVSGSGQIRTIWSVTLPLTFPALAYAWIFGFAQAFTEISVSAVLTGYQNPVGATVLLNFYDSNSGLQRACVVGVVMLLVTMSLVVITQRLGDRTNVAR